MPYTNTDDDMQDWSMEQADPDSILYRGTDMPTGCRGCGGPDDCYCPEEYLSARD